MFRICLFILACLFSVSASMAQTVDVRGRFLADSLQIGEPVPYCLTARYPTELNIVFPDSSFAFAPFEFSKKTYFATRSTASTSYDSVVYLLASYEVDSTQYLKLPVFVIHPEDCTAIFSETDAIALKHMVKNVPDSVAAAQLPLKTQTSYLNVKWLLNYPLLLIIGGILLAVLIAAWLIFGKRIRKHFKIRRLIRKHEQFTTVFENTVHQLTQGFTAIKAERALVIWKQYMEELDSRPYTKYTSREILQVEKDAQLGGALKSVDRMIYAGHPSEIESLTQLRNYSQLKFDQKLDSIRHE